MYSLIFGKRKKFEINTADVTYKVHYLGNVMTSIMKGDGCVDKAVNILWDNHVKNNGKAGIKMKLTLTQGGLEVETLSSGITEYYGHRIHYIIAHPLHPKLFVWVYQHVNKTLKTELRCHAVLCKHNRDAKLIAFMLNERLERTFAEYKREKKRMQTTRLCNNKNKLLSMNQHVKIPMRTISLSSTIKYYKPPIQRSMISAPKLDDVREEEEEKGEDEKEFLNDKQSIKDIKIDNKKLSNLDNKKEEVNVIVEHVKKIDCDELEINDDLLVELERQYNSNKTDDEVKIVSPTNSSSGDIKVLNNNVNKFQTDDSLSIYSNPCDSGIEESFTINYEFGNDIELLKQDKDIIKAYDELKNKFNSYKENEKVIENDNDNDDDDDDKNNEINIKTFSHKNEPPLHPHMKLENIDVSSPIPSSTKVSYDYLGDFNKINYTPVIRQTRSFRLKNKQQQHDQENTSIHIRNPFKRLQLSSSSFSSYTTYKKHQEHKLKQQQEHENYLKQFIINENNNNRSISPKLDHNFERLAVIVD